MKSLYLSVILLVLISLFGCQQQPDNNTVKIETIENEVKEQFFALVSTINQKDADAWSEYYSKDNFISTFVNTDYYSDRAVWADAITQYFSMREKQNLNVQQVRIDVLSPDMALLTSEENTTMSMEGGKIFKSKHVYTMVWQKEQEGWKILHSHESWVETE